MGPTNKLVCCLLLLVPLLSALPIEKQDQTEDDYLPRSIKQDEESVAETAPTMPPPPSQELNPPPIYTSNIKPVEFQHFLPLDTSDTSDSQSYHTYDVVVEDQNQDGAEEQPRNQYENDYVDDNGEGNVPNVQPNSDAGVPDSYLPDYEALLKKYFGPKSKFFYDKDEVGIVGKANRFKRSGADSSSSSYAYSQSSATGGGPSQFSNTGFSNVDGGYGHSGFAQGAPRNGFDGGMADIGTGFGYDGGYQSQGAGFGGGNFGSTGYHSASAYSNDGGNGGGILTRMGGGFVDGGNQGGSGVFAESGSSIDSNGKSTHYVNSGRL